MAKFGDRKTALGKCKLLDSRALFTAIDMTNLDSFAFLEKLARPLTEVIHFI